MSGEQINPDVMNNVELRMAYREKYGVEKSGLLNFDKLTADTKAVLVDNTNELERLVNGKVAIGGSGNRNVYHFLKTGSSGFYKLNGYAMWCGSPPGDANGTTSFHVYDVAMKNLEDKRPCKKCMAKYQKLQGARIVKERGDQ